MPLKSAYVRVLHGGQVDLKPLFLNRLMGCYHKTNPTIEIEAAQPFLAQVATDHQPDHWTLDQSLNGAHLTGQRHQFVA